MNESYENTVQKSDETLLKNGTDLIDVLLSMAERGNFVAYNVEEFPNVGEFTISDNGEETIQRSINGTKLIPYDIDNRIDLHVGIAFRGFHEIQLTLEQEYDGPFQRLSPQQIHVAFHRHPRCKGHMRYGIRHFPDSFVTRFQTLAKKNGWVSPRQETETLIEDFVTHLTKG